MRLHALVDDAAAARRAAERGATVIQLRLKGAPTARVVEMGGSLPDLGVTLVINDDVGAAVALRADGVHLGRGDEGAERARAAGLLLGLSAATPGEAAEAERRGASYIGAGPVWETPSKTDADPPIGLDGLAAIARVVSVPVVAIGGIDASSAGACVRAGASGVAVIRAVRELEAVRAAVDEALAAR